MSAVTATAAYVRREIQASVMNRLVQLFGVVMLCGGLLPVFLESGRSATTAPLLLLQVLLYLVPLFAILAGTGSAQNEQAESPLLLALPTPRWVRVAGKFAGLFTLLAVGLVLLFVPSVFLRLPLVRLAGLWGYGIGIAGVFVALGMAAGFGWRNPVKAHLASLIIWLAVSVVPGVAALALAGLPAVQSHPEGWLALLMGNPLDALRVGILFQVQSIPFDPSRIAALGQWWLSNPGIWFAAISTLWAAAALAVSIRQSSRL